MAISKADISGLGLSGVTKAGAEDLRRLGLLTEIGQKIHLDEASALGGRVASGHAPFGIEGMRLNIAAVDDPFREMSIKMVTDYIESAAAVPSLRKVNIHAAPRRWHREAQTSGREGSYDRLIDALRRIGAAARRHGIEIVVENNRAYWEGVAESTLLEEVDRDAQDVYFCTAPEEWIRACEDVAMENVRLCLDTSHACTYAQTFPEGEERWAAMDAFLARPELVSHVHWNGNFIDENRGRDDSHLGVGKGTLGSEFHRKIKSHGATKLLEHWHGLDALEEELEYILGL